MINVTIPNLDSILRRLPTAGKVNTVLMRAVNRAATSGREASRKKVNEDYTIKAAKFRKIAVIAKATKSNLQAEINWKSETSNLANFEHKKPPKPRKQRGKRRGRATAQLTASVRRGHPATYNGVFVGPNKRLYRRNGQFKTVNGVKREKISAVFGTSVTHLAGSNRAREAAQKAAKDMLIQRTHHEVNRMIGP